MATGRRRASNEVAQSIFDATEAIYGTKVPQLDREDLGDSCADAIDDHDRERFEAQR